MTIEPAGLGDRDALWAILRPMIRAGETYTLARDLRREEALEFWLATGHEVFIARDDDGAAGTYFLRANQKGGGAHVANCGYVVAPWASGRGVGRAMCEHSLERARARGFRAMQFNFVVSSNESACHLWQSCGFAVVGRLPAAFKHPVLGYVDALVMHRSL